MLEHWESAHEHDFAGPGLELGTGEESSSQVSGFSSQLSAGRLRGQPRRSTEFLAAFQK
jgi:hypothetical protein